MDSRAPPPPELTRPSQSLAEYGVKVILLAAIYYLTGKLGLSLAVPPGYATLIWPPSGIVLGVLLAHGRRLAPGVFLGSFLLNAMVGHTPQLLPGVHELLLAACIALGATVQALVGHALLVRFFGLPIRLRRLVDALRLLAVAGPLACVVSASVGVTSLYMLGDLPPHQILNNWFTWWAGDVFGMVVFLPLVLVMPGGAPSLTWRDRAVRGVHAISLTLLLVPLGLTFIAWRSLAHTEHRQSQVHFEALSKESEQAMRTRLAAYASATRSGAGVFQSSEFVSREEWRTFTETLRLRDDYPGLTGLGWIERGAVTYAEPEIVNGKLLGRRLDAEPRVREAAELAIVSGMATLTRPIRLGDEEDAELGFLLMQPVYADLPLGSPELRRAALRGYIYAQFPAHGFLAGLTPSQGKRLDVTLFDGRAVQADRIFSSRLAHSRAHFSVRREFAVYGQVWTVEWQSAPGFEQAEHARGAYVVLFGGLLFTGLFAVLLMVLGARRQALHRGGSLDQPWILPLATFVLVAGGSVAAWMMLSAAEDAQLSSQVESETRRIEADLERSVRARLQSQRRMAHRWASGGGTPYAVWRNDARDHVRQIAGLVELQWIGADYRVQWAEGARRNGWVENRDIRMDSELARALAASVERGTIYVTEPREIVPGESTFIVYVPLLRDARFDGFMAATYSSREFFHTTLDSLAGSAFAFAVQYDGVTYFDNGELPAANSQWMRQSGFQMIGRRWTFTVSPTQQYADSQKTLLPLIVLLAGGLIAVLASVLVRYVLLARLKAARLQTSGKALADSEQRYALAMRGMGVGLWDWDVASNRLFCSQKCQEMLGIGPGEFVPHYSEFASRLHPDDKVTVERALFGHLKGLNSYDIQYRLRRNDGQYLWVHAYGQAQFSADGHAERMAGSIQDITHLKQQEEELRRKEMQLRLLVENTPAAVAMFDSEMRYLLTSRRWLQDYGLEGRNIIGMSHYEVFPEIRSMPRWLDIHARALRGEKFDAREDCWVRANGQKEWNQWAIHPWVDAEGKVRGLVMFTELITARKTAEAALRTSEAMNRAAMDKAPIGKALVGPDGRFLKVNPALCRMLGYTEEEMLAADFQAITHPEDLAEDLTNVRALLDGKIVSYQMEKRYLHRDGRLIWAELSVSLVRRADGEPDFFVSQIQDISDRRAIGRIKDEFVSVISREVCAPLMVIRESLNMIAGMRDGELPTPVRRLFEASRASCDRLSTLVNDIHDLDKITAGRMHLEFRDECIALITRQAVEACEFHARKHDVSFSLAHIDPAVIVYVDPARAVQALTNLLSNAAKFSPPGAVIEVGAQLRGDSVRVWVCDHGDGIPEEFRARIFGRFSKAEVGGGGSRGGTGLGLHIARELVEQMRGNIGFATQAGAGSTFWVEFPIVTRAASAAALC